MPRKYRQDEEVLEPEKLEILVSWLLPWDVEELQKEWRNQSYKQLISINFGIKCHIGTKSQIHQDRNLVQSKYNLLTYKQSIV